MGERSLAERHGRSPGPAAGPALGGRTWFFLVPLLLAANAGHASDWRPVVTTPDGIGIFQKEATESGLIAFRGVGVVEAPLPVVATVIFDTSRRKDWIKGLAESRVVRWESMDHYVEYDHIAMPMFFSDRDFVSRVQVRYDRFKEELVFHYQPSDEPEAPQTGYLRGEMLNMTFLLRSVNEGRSTRIDAEFLSDPKGWIPAWLVNLFLRDWPTTTFRSLRREVQRPGIAADPRIVELLEPGPID